MIDLLAQGGVRDYIYPVGRLDYDSEGLLLLTSDGELAARLTHPRHGVAREYQVRVRGVPDATSWSASRAASRRRPADRARRGAAPPNLRVGVRPAGGLSLVIHEGRNRQVRKMCDAIGHPVVRLRRVRIGPIADDRLSRGSSGR